MAYDSNNVFAKILRGEIPAARLYEDDFAIAFPDITPSAPTHILVIPKGSYMHFEDFITNAKPTEIQGYFAAIEKIAAQHHLTDYRLISNKGEAAGQSVHHFHMHILAGTQLGPLLAK